MHLIKFNMKDKSIHRIEVNHRLQRTSDMRYICETTKTENGVREVPMTPDVMDAFKRIIKMCPMMGAQDFYF